MSNYDETKLEAAGNEGGKESSRRNEQSQSNQGKSEGGGRGSNLSKEDRQEGGKRSHEGSQNK